MQQEMQHTFFLSNKHKKRSLMLHLKKKVPSELCERIPTLLISFLQNER
jgi:hypothetical protein